MSKALASLAGFFMQINRTVLQTLCFHSIPACAFLLTRSRYAGKKKLRDLNKDHAAQTGC
jgi:hypothetical protein